MNNNRLINKDRVRWFHFGCNPIFCGKAILILDEKIDPKKQVRLRMLTLRELNQNKVGTVKPMSDLEYKKLVSAYLGIDENGDFYMSGNEVVSFFTYNEVMDKDPNFYRFEKVDFGDSKTEDLPDPKTCPHQDEHNAFCSKCGAKLKK